MYSTRTATDSLTGECLITLRGPTLRVTLSPSRGAELMSIQTLRRSRDDEEDIEEPRWIELLHRATELEEPEGDAWQGRAPVLWPAVGRNFTEEQLSGCTERPEECRYQLNAATTLPMPLHGFAKDVPWSVGEVKVTAASASTTFVCAL